MLWDLSTQQNVSEWTTHSDVENGGMSEVGIFRLGIFVRMVLHNMHRLKIAVAHLSDHFLILGHILRIISGFVHLFKPLLRNSL